MLSSPAHEKCPGVLASLRVAQTTTSKILACPTRFFLSHQRPLHTLALELLHSYLGVHSRADEEGLHIALSNPQLSPQPRHAGVRFLGIHASWG